MKSENPNFYYHVNTVEDLLKYLDNDLEDITLNEKFEFKIYTRRWGDYDLYSTIRNGDGWNISHLSYKGQGGKNKD